MEKKTETKRKRKGFLNPKVVRSISFYIITVCIVSSVIACILAIWNFANTDSLWRMIATFGVIGIGTAVFSFVNGVFGTDSE